MKSIEDRLKALGLTIKPKGTSRPMTEMDVKTLRAIAKNPAAHDETRVKALTELESRT